ALDIVRVTPTIETAIADFQVEFSNTVKIAVTGAARRPGSTALVTFRKLLLETDHTTISRFVLQLQSCLIDLRELNAKIHKLTHRASYRRKVKNEYYRFSGI